MSQNHPWSIELPKFGDAEQFTTWSGEQFARCDDSGFGQRFAEACPLPGIDPPAYQHRMLEFGGEHLLAGIRFKGGDVTHPFIDLLAWTGEPSPDWIPAIKNEFARLKPLSIRYAWPSDKPPPWMGEVDQYVYAGFPKCEPQEQIPPAHDLSWYQDFREHFDAWRSCSPLGKDVSPAETGDFQACLDDGHVAVASDNDGSFLGVAACRRGNQRALTGWTIIEEFVIPAAQGRGLGTALQLGLMQHLPECALVWGPIDGKNFASQATAARCGREAVETWWFVPIEPECR